MDAFVRRSIYYLAVDYYYQGGLQVQSMDDKGWAVPAALPKPGRLWFVLQTSVDGSLANRKLVLDDLYHQAPTLASLAWLQSLEPHLKGLQQFDGVTVLLCDFLASTP